MDIDVLIKEKADLKVPIAVERASIVARIAELQVRLDKLNAQEAACNEAVSMLTVLKVTPLVKIE